MRAQKKGKNISKYSVLFSWPSNQNVKNHLLFEQYKQMKIQMELM